MSFDNQSLLLSALGIAAFECLGNGRIQIIGVPPAWFHHVFENTEPQLEPQELLSASPFLSDFLQEATEFWGANGTILNSGTWSQRNLIGEEAAYEAWAIRTTTGRFIVLKLLEDFEQRREIYQKAREIALAYERLGRKHRELNEIKDALQARNREAERVTELKNEFLASVSHELRTPLNAILGFSTLLEEQRPGPLNPEQLDHLNRISKASRHLLALINDILDLSKIEADRLDLHPEILPLGETLAEVLSAIRPLARERNINIAVRLDPRETVYADKLRFKQVLYNLLNNAVKFTPDYGEIAIDHARDNESSVISVSDNGVGIPAGEEEAIFEKFHQARPSVRGVREGAGLGLAITRKIIERHGGKIWVESAPGNTRFVFTLPLPSSGAHHDSQFAPERVAQ